MAKSCQSQLLLPFSIPGTNCLFEAFSGIVLTVTGNPSPSGLYWNNITGMLNPFPYSNPSNFPLQVGDHICMNLDDGEITSVQSGIQITIQYFIGATAVTNPILFTIFSNAGSIQYLIDQAIIDPNVTIIVNSANISGLDVSILVNTETFISSSFIVTADPPVEGQSSFSSPFTCNFSAARRKKRAAGVVARKIHIYLNDAQMSELINSNQRYDGISIKRNLIGLGSASTGSQRSLVGLGLVSTSYISIPKSINYGNDIYDFSGIVDLNNIPQDVGNPNYVWIPGSVLYRYTIKRR